MSSRVEFKSVYCVVDHAMNNKAFSWMADNDGVFLLILIIQSNLNKYGYTMLYTIK